MHCQSQIRVIVPQSATMEEAQQHNFHPLMPGEDTSQRIAVRLKQATIDDFYKSLSKEYAPVVVIDLQLHYRTIFDADGAGSHVTGARFLITPPWGKENDPQFHFTRKAFHEWLKAEGGIQNPNFDRDDYGPAVMT